MTQDELAEYLNGCGCLVVRRDNKGYIVMRNPITGKISGIPLPKDGQSLRVTTICQICRNLDAEIPDSAKVGEGIIDYVRIKHLEKGREN